MNDSSMFIDNLRPHQKFYTVKQIEEIGAKRAKEGTNQLNLSGYDQRDLQKLLNKHQNEIDGRMDEEEPNDTNNKKKKEDDFFQGNSVSLKQDHHFAFGKLPISYSDLFEGMEDPEMYQAIKMSMEDVSCYINYIDVYNNATKMRGFLNA